MARIGSFDPTLRPETWFDETGVPEGFFDYNLIDAPAEPEPEPETPSSINQSQGVYVERVGGGGAANYDQSNEEAILAVIQAFMSCQ